MISIRRDAESERFLVLLRRAAPGPERRRVIEMMIATLTAGMRVDQTDEVDDRPFVLREPTRAPRRPVWRPQRPR
jgi:hypothetical protein